MRRFFFNPVQRQGDTVTLRESESRHICRVLRLKEGESVELVDDTGRVFSAIIKEAAQLVRLVVQGEGYTPASGSTRLLVGVSAIKIKKMELLLQKCTELGVDAFYPVAAARSQGNLIRQYEGKNERWHRIIEEACKQSLRPLPMDLHKMVSFAELLCLPEVQTGGSNLLFYEKEQKTSLVPWLAECRAGSTIMLLFGPEGGFTGEEVADALSAGWSTASLGERLLRAETAVIAAVSIVQHHLGHM
ncbi:MAG: RsmE family RNA methyltransferase [Desulfopila sp.]|jgi:16S rRNA (uracil1498-N3)-methyltransferase|nr:RsmE family RNA methyltransferase [Desulfopila sp.]